MNKLLLGSTLGALLVTVVAAAGGCNGKTSTDNTGNLQPSGTVGAAGGTVTSSDGQATVQIPAGALTADVTIQIYPVSTGTLPTSSLAIGRTYEFAPPGTTFTKPVTVTLPFDGTKIPTPTNAADVRILTAEDDSQSYTEVPTSPVDGTHVSAQTTHFSRYVPTLSVPQAEVDGSLPSLDAGPPSTDNCIVSCEGPDNIDSGIGCNCGVTCNGVVYGVQCVCGACTCYQDGVPGKTTTLSTTACDNGASSLITTYFNLCGYPGSKNAGGGGGPPSMDGGGSCPGG